MGDFLLKLLELSLWAGILTIVVLGIRLVFRKIPAKYLCVLWMIVAARLILPFSLESSFAPLPSFAELSMLFPGDGEVHGVMTEYHEATVVPSGESADNVPGVLERLDETDYYIGDSNKGGAVTTEPMQEDTEEVDYYITSESGQVYMEPERSDTNHQVWLTAGTKDTIRMVPDYVPAVAAVWLTGVVLLLAYGFAGCLKVKRMVKNAILYKDNVWLCEGLESPFLFGWVHPKIYLPTNLEEAQMQYVIGHEKSHIARGDHFAKLAGYVLFAVYWFNPLIWVAYVMFCKDVERACDERVIAGFGVEDRKGYAEALLECSVGCRFLISHPLAFGEIDVKQRIQGILNYKKPGTWLVAGSIVVCLLVAAGCAMVREPEQQKGEGVVNAGPEVMAAAPTPTNTPVPMSTLIPTVTPTPTSIPTATLAPTNTLAPTSMPEPTGTSVSTNTPEPTSTQLPESTPTPTTVPTAGAAQTILPVVMNDSVTLDLNGDGIEETVRVTSDVEFVLGRQMEKIGYYPLATDPVLTVTDAEGNQTVWQCVDSADPVMYYIIDLDVTDGYKEIGIADLGLNGFSSTDLFRYVEGEIVNIGYIHTKPLDSPSIWYNYEPEEWTDYQEYLNSIDRTDFLFTLPGDGTFSHRKTVWLFETTGVTVLYQLENEADGGGSFKEVLLEEYEFTGWKHDRGEYTVTAAAEFEAYRDKPVTEEELLQTVTVPAGAEISFYRYFPDGEFEKGWVQFGYGENLDSFGWFYFDGRKLQLPGGSWDSWEVFDNLSFAG